MPLPPVVINAVVIGAILSYVLELPLVATMLSVGAGQVGACYVLGMALYTLFWIKTEVLFSKNSKR